MAKKKYIRKVSSYRALKNKIVKLETTIADMAEARLLEFEQAEGPLVGYLWAVVVGMFGGYVISLFI